MSNRSMRIISSFGRHCPRSVWQNQHPACSLAQCSRYNQLNRSVTSCKPRFLSVHAAAVSTRRIREGKEKQDRNVSRDRNDKIAFQKAGQQQDAIAVLHKGRSRLFYEGSPMVYKGNIEKLIAAHQPVSGDAVLLADHNLALIGWGVHNTDSLYSIRMLQWQDEMQEGPNRLNIGALITHRLQQAVQARATLGLPSETTNVYRLVNCEGDRLSGLVVDVFGTSVVVSSSAAWIEQHRQLIEDSLVQLLGCKSIVWRPATGPLQLEGHPVLPQSQANPTDESGDYTEPQSDQRQSPFVTVMEDGIQYKVDLHHGQKTGFYADQRDSRAVVRSLARGKRILDLCCYTGGFAIAAAKGGAASVTGVDSSGSAIALAKENAELNDFQRESLCSFHQTDIESYMRDAHRENRTWDLVILDPPKLAPKKSALTRASRKYVGLNTAALRLVASGGLFMTCSCSGAIAQGEGLLPLVKEAARSAGRRLSLLRSAGAALDHPLDPAFPEGQYLTNLLFRVE